MLTLFDDVFLAVQDEGDKYLKYGKILTSSDIKKEMKTTDSSFLEVAQGYTLIGMDDNGNSYYV